MAVRVALDDPTQPVGQALIAALSAELGAMYGDDGAGGFVPADVMIPGAAFVVAWLDETAVGCGALRPLADDATVAEIKRMYVHPAARGRGVSRQILAKLESLAREYGYRAAQLETGTLQQAAIGLYESSGYVRIPCYGAYADDPHSVCYRKELA